MRERDRHFVLAVRERGIPLTDEERRDVAEVAWPTMEEWNQPALNRKIKQKLRQPDVRAALSSIYEAVGSFTPAEAFALQIAHMRKGHYPALRDYMISAMPTQAKKVEIDSRSLNVNVMADHVPQMRDGPPPTRSRVISRARGSSAKVVHALLGDVE